MPGRPARRRDLGSYPLVDVVADVPRESVPPGRHDKRVSTAGISRNRSWLITVYQRGLIGRW